MPKIHFITGHAIDISEEDWTGFLKRFNSSGMKYWVKRSTGDVVPFNVPSMAFIEREAPDGSIRQTEDSKSVRGEDEDTGEVSEDDKGSDDSEDRQRTQEEILEEMKAKSQCGMNKHEGQKQIIYKQPFKAAKGGKVYFKYYPICGFCGEKGRFIAADKLPDDVKEAALDHKE